MRDHYANYELFKKNVGNPTLTYEAYLEYLIDLRDGDLVLTKQVSEVLARELEAVKGKKPSVVFTHGNPHVEYDLVFWE